MARIRTVKPMFFRHRRLFLAEQETGLPLRVAYAGLWTVADREGRFRWEPEEIKLDCLPFDDVDFSRVMDALFTRGFIVKYTSGGRQYGVIPSFKDHQVINNREATSSLPEPPENLEELVELANLSDASATRDPRDTDLHKRKGKEGKGKEGNGKEGKGTSTRDASADADFDQFKKAYPRRGGSNPWQPARQLFAQCLKAGHSSLKIIGAARAYAAECDKSKIAGTEKVAQAVTWLRQARFLDHDEPSEVPAGFVLSLRTPEQARAWLEAKSTAGENTAFMKAQLERGGSITVPSEYPPGHERAA
jgi:hypothetical protein